MATLGLIVLVGLVGIVLLLAILSNPVSAARAFVVLLPYSYAASLVGYAHYRQLQSLQDLVMLLIALTLAFGKVRTDGMASWLKIVLAGWVILVLIGLANPRLINLDVGVIGARGWLLYPCAMLLGAAIIQESRDIQSDLRKFLLIGLPVLAVGLYDGLQIMLGKEFFMIQFVPGSRNVLVSNASFGIGEGRLTRIYSVFPYPLAYFVFTLVYLAVALSLTQSSVGKRRRQAIAFTTVGATASLASGTRLAMVLVPMILATAAITSVDRRKAMRLTLAVFPAGSFVFALLTGISVTAMPGYLWELAKDEFEFLIVSGLSDSFKATVFGLGPGMDSNAAAASGGASMYQDFGGKWRESFFAKSWLELGVLGFALAVVFMAGAIWSACGVLRADADSWKSGFAALLLAFVFILPKGSIIERAPAGVYFWVVMGVLTLEVARRPKPLVEVSA